MRHCRKKDQQTWRHETIQNETKRQKRFKINRIPVGYRRILIGLTLESPEEMKEEAKKKEKFWDAKKFSKFDKTINPQTQEVQLIPSIRNMKESAEAWQSNCSKSAIKRKS